MLKKSCYKKVFYVIKKFLHTISPEVVLKFFYKQVFILFFSLFVFFFFLFFANAKHFGEKNVTYSSKNVFLDVSNVQAAEKKEEPRAFQAKSETSLTKKRLVSRV